MGTLAVTTHQDIFSVPKDGAVTVIGHGVNVRGVMGAGFARLIATKYPGVKAEYMQACSDASLTPGLTQIIPVSPSLAIANIASQENPGADATEDNLRDALRNLYAMTAVVGVPVHVRLPLIGAGIGGLDPITVAGIIFTAACDAAGTVGTTLYLRDADEHTPAVVSYHRGWTLGE